MSIRGAGRLFIKNLNPKPVWRDLKQWLRDFRNPPPQAQMVTPQGIILGRHPISRSEITNRNPISFAQGTGQSTSGTSGLPFLSDLPKIDASRVQKAKQTIDNYLNVKIGKGKITALYAGITLLAGLLSFVHPLTSIAGLILAPTTLLALGGAGLVTVLLGSNLLGGLALAGLIHLGLRKTKLSTKEKPSRLREVFHRHKKRVRELFVQDREALAAALKSKPNEARLEIRKILLPVFKENVNQVPTIIDNLRYVEEYESARKNQEPLDLKKYNTDLISKKMTELHDIKPDMSVFKALTEMEKIVALAERYGKDKEGLARDIFEERNRGIFTMGILELFAKEEQEALNKIVDALRYIKGHRERRSMKVTDFDNWNAEKTEALLKELQNIDSNLKLIQDLVVIRAELELLEKYSKDPESFARDLQEKKAAGTDLQATLSLFTEEQKTVLEKLMDAMAYHKKYVELRTAKQDIVPDEYNVSILDKKIAELEAIKDDLKTVEDLRQMRAELDILEKYSQDKEALALDLLTKKADGANIQEIYLDLLPTKEQTALTQIMDGINYARAYEGARYASQEIDPEKFNAERATRIISGLEAVTQELDVIETLKAMRKELEQRESERLDSVPEAEEGKKIEQAKVSAEIEHLCKRSYKSEMEGLRNAYNDIDRLKKIGKELLSALDRKAIEDGIAEKINKIREISKDLGLFFTAQTLEPKGKEYFIFPAEKKAEEPIGVLSQPNGGGTPAPVVRNGYHLGSGAMAQVYKALDAETGKIVAVKILTNLTIKDRFEMEFKNQAKKNFKKVVNVYAHGGITVDNVTYPLMTMEFIEWPDLFQYLKQQGRKLDPLEAAEIGLQICDAMWEVHKEGLAHRDLKIENIFINPDPEKKEIKIGDFGLTIHSEDMGRSVTGLYAGTPPYSAPYYYPEYCSKSSQERKERADFLRPFLEKNDIYAVGVMLYRLVTGGRLIWHDGQKLFTIAGSSKKSSKTIEQIDYTEYAADYKNYITAKNTGNKVAMQNIKNKYKLVQELERLKIQKVPDNLYKIICIATALDPAETFENFFKFKTALEWYKENIPISEPELTRPPQGKPGPEMPGSVEVSVSGIAFDIKVRAEVKNYLGQVYQDMYVREKEWSTDELRAINRNCLDIISAWPEDGDIQIQYAAIQAKMTSLLTPGEGK